MSGIEWGHRFWDDSVAASASQGEAWKRAARFKRGCVEVVHRAGPDEPWQRAQSQPHTSEQRMDALQDAQRFSQRLADWRGARLVDLGHYPNPPGDER